MLSVIARFEFATRVRRVSTAVYFTLFFALSFLWLALAGGVFPDADIGFGAARIAINSPFSIARASVILTAFSMIVVAAIMGRAVQEDVEARTTPFFATAPISKSDFLIGRFLGGFGVVAVILLSLPLGAWLATFLPGIDPARLEANRLSSYVLPYLWLSLPDALATGAFFFFLAATTRRMLPVYVGSVLLIVAWTLSLRWVQDLDNRALGALIDPFGRSALTEVTRYWTAPERNQRALGLSGLLLVNRVFWLVLAFLFALIASLRFSMAHYAGGLERFGDVATRPDTPVAGALRTHAKPHRPTMHLQGALLPMTLVYLRSIVSNVYFGVLVAAGLVLAITLANSGGRIYGTATWPVTAQMIDSLSAPFTLFMLVIITFYAGELVWREREVRISQIVDASPTTSVTLLASKLLALMAVPAMLEGVLMLAGISVQLSHGYTHVEPGLYLHDLFGIQLIDFWLLCVLALTVHTVLDHKYVAHFILVLYYIADISSSALGFEDNLYKFGETGDITYSDMNGFGHALIGVRFFEIYWGFAALLLLIAAFLLMVRGTPASFLERIANARLRAARMPRLVLPLALLSFVGSGSFIYYNTHVLNRFHTARSDLEGQADYEKSYRFLAALPQPRIAAVTLAIDIRPESRSAVARGHYDLENRTAHALSLVNLDFPAGGGVVLKSLAASRPFQYVINDAELGMRQMRLAAALQPGEHMGIDFVTALESRGFAGAHEETAVVENGTFFNGRMMLPHVGYDSAGELTRPGDRKKFGLPEKPAMRAQDDPVGLAANYIADDADWIPFEVDLGTGPDQLAVAPGDLVRTYSQNGRAHFVYRSSRPILNFFAFQSARYARANDVWHGPEGDVPIAIDYQSGHEFDLARMISAVKDALAYDTANFAPYQYDTFRIVEFPRYQMFAESFPNTTPYSEGLGFIARVNDDDARDIDYPFFVTAHEVSHQWWGYQMVGANVLGATMLSESLAQYSAMMVLKHRYGDMRMRRFLAFELDTYLTGRANEGDHEVPLSKVENQTYIHYAKGALVMYALQDALGEARVNRVLSEMLAAHASKGAPYPTSGELVQRFRDAAPAQFKSLVTDLFDRIVLFDCRALSATARKNADGTYLVSVEVEAQKREADGQGNESYAALDDWIDIGALDDKGNAIVLQKHHFTDGKLKASFIADRLPARAGIDPLHKLIDRNPGAAMLPVEIAP